MSATVQAKAIDSKPRSLAIAANRAVYWLAQRWIVMFAVLAGAYAGLPWLAPVLMQAGWTAGGEIIYALYSTQCHQLPQRSFFLFGPQAMYSLEQIQAVMGDTDNPLVLRAFIGSPEMGWKVAWSDRMVSMYSAPLLLGLLYWPLRRRLRPLPGWGLVLLMLPVAADGLTHMVSDLSGLGAGFRDSNAWLAVLTSHSLPATFYVGDALGGFNSWMRLITGVLFALGVVWFTFPYLEQWMAKVAADIEAKLDRAGLRR